MILLRRIARPLLASMFVAGGLDTLRNPSSKVETAEPVTARVSGILPDALPKDTAQLVRINGAVQFGGGLLLAVGKFPRLSALALAGTVVPTTAAGHRFWEQEDPGMKVNQRIHFLKNLSMLGGLLLAVADTAGKPSLGRRAKAAAKQTKRAAKQTKRDAKLTRAEAKNSSRRATRKARKALS